jgi:hypothetical protein
VAWLALFPQQEDFRKVPILVNGDDILFRCRESQLPTWHEHIKNAGFRASVGKNFAHVDKIFINSQPWVAQKRSDFDTSKQCEFEYLPFFNVGLLHGQSKVAKRPPVENEASSVYQPLYSLQPEAVRGARNVQRAIKRFHSIHKEHLRHSSADGFFSYHAPREFYGLGMVGKEGSVYTKTQAMIANITYRKGLELSNEGKLYVGDGIVSKPMHDLSRMQGRRTLYTGTIVPPERLAPGASGYTVLHRVEHSMLGRTQDVLWDEDSEQSMLATAYDLRHRLEKRMKKYEAVPHPTRLIDRGFCQRPVPSSRYVSPFSREQFLLVDSTPMFKDHAVDISSPMKQRRVKSSGCEFRGESITCDTVLEDPVIWKGPLSVVAG